MIELFDNFLSGEEIKNLYSFCLNQNYTLSGKARYYDDEKFEKRDLSLIKHLDLSRINFDLLSEIRKKISDIIGDEYTCFRTYLNAFKFSDASLRHTDFHPPNTEGITAVIYCNSNWDVDLGGETVFLETNSYDSEIIRSIIPKPGRMVLFCSDIPHIARCPNVLHSGYKYTLIYNFESSSKKNIK